MTSKELQTSAGINGTGILKQAQKTMCWLDLALDVDNAKGRRLRLFEKSIARLQHERVVLLLEQLFAAVIDNELGRLFVRFEGELVRDES